MYRVLMPIDEDERRAAAQAEAVAELPDADGEVLVTLLYVQGVNETTDLVETPAGSTADEILDEAGVRVEPQVRIGNPAEEILDTARDVDADVIVLGGRKRSPLGSLLFGSVTQAVIVDASRPVTVTGGERRERPSHECQACGETYYTDPDESISSCRRCGGVNVESVR